MSVREDIKILLTKENITLTKLAELLTKKNNKKYTVYELSRKLNQGTMKYDEAKEIADCLGYEIEYKKKL